MINEKAIKATNFIWSIYLLVMLDTLSLILVTRAETPRYYQHHIFALSHLSTPNISNSCMITTYTTVPLFTIVSVQDSDLSGPPIFIHCIHALWLVTMNQDETTWLVGQLPTPTWLVSQLSHSHMAGGSAAPLPHGWWVSFPTPTWPVSQVPHSLTVQITPSSVNTSVFH